MTRRAAVEKTTAESTKLPRLKIELWSIERIRPYARNARTHNAAQIEQLRMSMRQFGWTNPILVREDGTIIAGHGRFEAAQLERLAKLPVIVAAGWTEEQCRTYTIADNKLAEMSGWNRELLSIELGDLKVSGVDLASIGFSAKEFDKLLSNDTSTAPVLGPDLIYSIVVRCENETHQRELIEQFEGQGLKCEVLMS